MQLNDLQPKSKQTKKRIGRGGNRGKTSGKGHKGQLARAGSGPRPQMRDRIKKIPKLRGYKNNPVKAKPVAVNLETIERVAEKGDVVSPQYLRDAGVVRANGGQLPKVKILGGGEISTAVTVVRMQASDAAKEAIEAAGGEVKS